MMGVLLSVCMESLESHSSTMLSALSVETIVIKTLNSEANHRTVSINIYKFLMDSTNRLVFFTDDLVLAANGDWCMVFEADTFQGDDKDSSLSRQLISDEYLLYVILIEHKMW